MAATRGTGGYDLPPGRILGGGYEVLSQLGKGWEGEVYKVREIRTGIERAAKLFFQERNPRGRATLRYAHKLNKLKDCPVIIQYHHHDYARIRGRKVEFVVSDYVDGEMLSAFVARQRGKRLRPFEALHVLYALARGVEPIHHMSEYHGDIHSDNVIMRRKGIGFEVKLLDFFDLGAPTREKIQYDIIDLVHTLHEMIGGAACYSKAGPVVHQLVKGLKHTLILKQFRTAGQLREALENLQWTD